MIQILPITNSNKLHVDFRQTYEESFPSDERREWDQLTELIDSECFCLNEIYSQQNFIGFISVWNLDQIRFIEHFAIRESERRKGFGSRVLKQILTENINQLVLEVEEPTTEIAQKRIDFYKRLNFKVSGVNYYQPPYSPGKKRVKMLLMSYPEMINIADSHGIIGKIYKNVYRVNEANWF